MKFWRTWRNGSSSQDTHDRQPDRAPDVWENLISINGPDTDFEVLGPARDYMEADRHPTNWKAKNLPIADALERDACPLPATADREGYYGPHHFSYWASGLRDMLNLRQCARLHDVEVNTYLDFGCASGRVLRHFSLNSDTRRVLGCDINRRHIEWILRHLPDDLEVFQTTSIPHIPLEDSSVDLVSALSVFTHIENFDLAWMMEIRRILRPGGLAWITFHSEKLWTDMKESSEVYKNWRDHPEFAEKRRHVHEQFDRLVFRRRHDRSYSSNVFYHTGFLRSRWGRILNVLEVRRRVPTYQDVMILQKPVR